MLELAKLLPLATFAIAATTSSAAETQPAKFICGSNGIQILNANATGSVVILDYGHEVEGIPSFEILSHQGDTSLFEISYAESLASFSQHMVCVAIMFSRTQRQHAYRPSLTVGWTTAISCCYGHLPCKSLQHLCPWHCHESTYPGWLSIPKTQSNLTGFIEPEECWSPAHCR